MRVEAVTELPRELAHVRVHAGDPDRDLRVRDRSGAEERRHEREAVVVALEARLGAVLPAVPDCADAEDHLAEARAWCFPLDAEAPFVVAFHLCPEPEDEATLRLRREVPRDLRVHERAAWKGDGDGRAELDPLAVLPDERERQIGVV